jgi:Family of unknown function (DUF6157)
MATGYVNAFITIAPDCPVTEGTVPRLATSIAGLEHALLLNRPYDYTAHDLILEVNRHHKNVPDIDLDAFKAFLFAKSHPCMRLSMLTKRWGWGVHYDGQGRMALYGAETDEYRQFAMRSDLRVMAARPSRRLLDVHQRTIARG